MSNEYIAGNGGYYNVKDKSGPYAIADDGTPTLIGAGSGGGGSTGGLTNAQLRASPLDVHPGFSTGGNIKVTTSSAGSTYSTLPSQACGQITVVNDLDVTLEVQQGGTGVGCPVLAQSSFTFFGVSNANQLGVRRKDLAAEQLDVYVRWEN